MMNWLFESFVDWLLTLLLRILDNFSTGFLGIFAFDFNTLFTYFPILKKVMEVNLYVAFSLSILLLIFRLCCNLLCGILDEYESPFKLCLRFGLAVFLIGRGQQLIKIFFNFMNEYNNVILGMNAVKEVPSFFANMAKMFESSMGIVGSIICFILSISIFWNFFKLLLEIIERYIVLGLLIVFSSFGFASLTTASTSRIFKSYLNMLFSHSMLIVMNSIFIKGAINAFNIYIVKGPGMGNGAFTDHLIWCLCMLAFLKAGQRVDSYMKSMGLDVAQTGSAVSEGLGALAGLGAMATKMGTNIATNGIKGAMKNSTGGTSGFTNDKKQAMRDDSFVGKAMNGDGTVTPGFAKSMMKNEQTNRTGQGAAMMGNSIAGSVFAGKMQGCSFDPSTTSAIGGKKGNITGNIINPDGTTTAGKISFEQPKNGSFVQIGEGSDAMFLQQMDKVGSAPLGGYGTNVGDFAPLVGEDGIISNDMAQSLGIDNADGLCYKLNESGTMSVFDGTGEDANYMGELVPQNADTNKKGLSFDTDSENGNEFAFIPNAEDSINSIMDTDSKALDGFGIVCDDGVYHSEQVMEKGIDDIKAGNYDGISTDASVVGAVAMEQEDGSVMPGIQLNDGKILPVNTQGLETFDSDDNSYKTGQTIAQAIPGLNDSLPNNDKVRSVSTINGQKHITTENGNMFKVNNHANTSLDQNGGKAMVLPTSDGSMVSISPVKRESLGKNGGTRIVDKTNTYDRSVPASQTMGGRSSNEANTTMNQHINAAYDSYTGNSSNYGAANNETTNSRVSGSGTLGSGNNDSGKLSSRYDVGNNETTNNRISGSGTLGSETYESGKLSSRYDVGNNENTYSGISGSGTPGREVYDSSKISDRYDDNSTLYRNNDSSTNSTNYSDSHSSSKNDNGSNNTGETTIEYNTTQNIETNQYEEKKHNSKEKSSIEAVYIEEEVFKYMEDENDKLEEKEQE